MGGVTNGQGSTLAFTANNETWTIAKGALIYPAAGSDAVQSNVSGSRLINNGFAISNGQTGAEMNGLNARIVNNASGQIFGYYGVYSDFDGFNVLNRGLIAGQNTAVWFDDGVSGGVLNNLGRILSPHYGVLAYGGGVEIHNSGTIRVTDLGAYAILLQPGTGRTTVENKAGGVIAGPTAVSANFTPVDLTNDGRIAGHVEFGNDISGDVIINRGVMVGTIELSGGNDKYLGAAGRAGHVFGGDGNDRLTGGPGKDWFEGGLLRDTLTGGGNADRFVYTSYTDSTTGAFHDVIRDFKHAQHDRIDLAFVNGVDPLLFRGTQPLAGGGTESVNYVIHNPAGTANDRVNVFVDVTGDGAADMEIELKGIHHLVAGDFYL